MDGMFTVYKNNSIKDRHCVKGIQLNIDEKGQIMAFCFINFFPQYPNFEIKLVV